MANWIIKLGNETKTTGSGNNITYNFPPNGDGSQQVYTISYTSDTNCTASTTYTVPACSLKSFTVYSDVEGASVSWSNGSTGTITGGICTINVGGYNSLTATLSKNGVTFSNNGASCSADGWVLITNAADYVTVNGVDWATKNLGQSSITGMGSTYKWGATTACPGGSAWDGGYDITTDRSNHDIAYIQTSGSLVMPTFDQINSFINGNVIGTSLTINGVEGGIFVDSNNGNSIYIPSGKYWSTYRVPQGGSDAGNAEYLEISDSGGQGGGNDNIGDCYYIRPIHPNGYSTKYVYYSLTGGILKVCSTCDDGDAYDVSYFGQISYDKHCDGDTVVEQVSDIYESNCGYHEYNAATIENELEAQYTVPCQQLSPSASVSLTITAINGFTLKEVDDPESYCS